MYLFIEFYYRELNIFYYYYKVSGHLFIEQKCLRQLICTCRVDFPTIIFQTTGSSSSLHFWRVQYIILCKRYEIRNLDIQPCVVEAKRKLLHHFCKVCHQFSIDDNRKNKIAPQEVNIIFVC